MKKLRRMLLCALVTLAAAGLSGVAAGAAATPETDAAYTADIVIRDGTTYDSRGNVLGVQDAVGYVSDTVGKLGEDGRAEIAVIGCALLSGVGFLIANARRRSEK